MSGLLIGYARVSTEEQDLTAQHNGLTELGSLPDARAIAEDLTKRKVRLSLGGLVYDPTDPVGRCCSMCWRWWPSSKRT